MQQCFWKFVWSLVCGVAALMLLHNALNYIWGPKPVCRFFVRDVYLGSRRGLSQTSLWCALRSIPAYWGSTLLGLSWSAWFLSRLSYRPQRPLPVLSDFTQSETLRIIQRVSSFPPEKLPDVFVLFVFHCGRMLSLQWGWMWWVKSFSLEREQKAPWEIWPAQKKKKCFSLNLTKHENRTCC